jgi:predicted nucleic acid-binding protein
MRVILDTNVVLDVLLDREPWNAQSMAVWQAHLARTITAYFSASSLTDVYYVARRHAGRDLAWQAIETCLDQLHVIAVGVPQLELALVLSGTDFEDNLVASCAATQGLVAIVTRDPKGFSHQPIQVLSPQDLIAGLNA